MGRWGDGETTDTSCTEFNSNASLTENSLTENCIASLDWTTVRNTGPSFTSQGKKMSGAYRVNALSVQSRLTWRRIYRRIVVSTPCGNHRCTLARRVVMTSVAAGNWARDPPITVHMQVGQRNLQCH